MRGATSLTLIALCVLGITSILLHHAVSDQRLLKRGGAGARGIGNHRPITMAAPRPHQQQQQQRDRDRERPLVILGSGLAGLSAAIEAARTAPSLSVVVLEKNPTVGGNSAKASSGINAVGPDPAAHSEEQFVKDTLRSGGGLSDEALVRRMASSSRDAIRFLESLGGVDLSSVVRLGGHSAPRTRTTPAGGPNVGLALVKAAEAAARAAPNVRIVTGARVESVAYGADGRTIAVTYRREEGEEEEVGTAAPAGRRTTLMAGGLVFASGGYAASRELLRRHAGGDVAALPTTNGPWATGDGLSLAASLGARLVQLDSVQVHPTGFAPLLLDGGGGSGSGSGTGTFPAAAAPPSRFLAPEKLRGCGALLLDSRGRRFVDELATRAAVVEAMMANPHQAEAPSPGLPAPPPAPAPAPSAASAGAADKEGAAWLLLGAEGAERFGEGALRFYESKGLARRAADVAAVAEAMGVDAAGLEAELRAYDEWGAAAAAAAGAAGAAEASAAAASAAARPDPHGKRFFPSRALSARPGGGPLWVARVAPAVHYTMGGVQVDEWARVVAATAAASGADDGDGDNDGGGGEKTKKTKKLLPRVWAAGEAAGGVHGANRLGGNSLLECVVFGRIAGAGAAKELMSAAEEEATAGAAEAVAAAAAAAAGAEGRRRAEAPVPSEPSTRKQQRAAVIASAI